MILAAAAPSSGVSSIGAILLVVIGACIFMAVKFKKLKPFTLLTVGAFGGLLFTETGIGSTLHVQLLHLGGSAWSLLTGA